ncbi:phospholipase A1-like [Periplaneta americana]|uniref:phospholipase A1-like n=1 Tax=Periplaneta americana TaxID=6978 RepID=UPI0037E8CADF
MNSLPLILVLLQGIVSINGQDEVKCPDGNTYSMDPPWLTLTRPVPPPNCVENVDYLLYTKSNPSIPFNCSTQNHSLDGSHYDGEKPTVMFFHGWMSSANAELMRPLGPAYLSRVDANVIFVDYSNVSSDIMYPQAVSDIRVVATLVARFVNYLIENRGTSISKFHLVGMSLGAHLAAYVAKLCPGVSRLTGLDPAGPLFEENSCEVGICKGDAKYVELIHTNGNPIWGLGIRKENGDINFRANGGYDQPGCGSVIDNQTLARLKSGNFNIIRDAPVPALCSHSRALHYYKEALRNKNCTFWAVKAKPLTTAASRLSGGYATWYLINPISCTVRTCVPMGIETINHRATGTYLVATNDKEQYCVSMPFTSAAIQAKNYVCNIIKTVLGWK